MTKILKGNEVAKAINESTIRQVEELKAAGRTLTPAILRAGERDDDISSFDRELTTLNEDPQIHGIIMFRPLPQQLDNERACRMLTPQFEREGVRKRYEAV